MKAILFVTLVLLAGCGSSSPCVEGARMCDGDWLAVCAGGEFEWTDCNELCLDSAGCWPGCVGTCLEITGQPECWCGVSE